MKSSIKPIAWTAITALALGVLLGRLWFSGSAGQPASAPDSAVTTSEKSLWTCSMHPQIRQSEPGDCPICGMDLIPLSPPNESDDQAVRLSPFALQLVDVRTAAVGKSKPIKHLRLTGKVQMDERLLVTQSTHIAGRIEQLMVNFTGETIAKGQVIAYLYSPELVTAQQELLAAKKLEKIQPRLYSAAKQKLQNWKLLPQQIDEIAERGEPHEVFPVHADVSGTVVHKAVNPGDYVQRGQELYQIADLSHVWVLFDVYESDMPWINVGDRVEFAVASLPGDTFFGRIVNIDPVIDPQTRTARARVEAANPDHKLKPEMFAKGTLHAELADAARLTVPKTAVMWTGKRSVAYVKTVSETGAAFVLRDVVLEADLGDAYIVESGLQEGEEIVVNGAFTIDAAAQLAGKPSMMNPAGDAPAGKSAHDHAVSPTTKMSALDRETAERSHLSAEAKQALQPLYTAYFDLKDHLVRDDLPQALQAATAYKNALNKVDMTLFSGANHGVWMQHQADFKADLQHIAHIKEIKDLRNSFQSLSNTLISLTESWGSPVGETHILHCPMADDDKGADWLSKEKEVKNPYFGAAMLRCGSVTRTIK
ncbi:efflux RND transporter periplasmic adaptor subunit [candidate division KSB1 bacterium]|nr:efflux RND transporter periplasmic adaptor subunit [candidate division KSB1 bacterium]